MSVAFVCVSEPSCSLLLAAHERNPLVTAAAQTFPDIGVAIHAAGFLRLLEWAAGRSADTVGETLIVPEGAVLQNEPPAWFADSTPTFALIAVAADPARCVEVSIESELLLVWDEIWVGRIHVFRWRRNLLLMK